MVVTYSSNNLTLKDFLKYIIRVIILIRFSHKFLEDIKVRRALHCLNPLVKQYLPSLLTIKIKVEKMAIKAEETI